MSEQELTNDRPEIGLSRSLGIRVPSLPLARGAVEALSVLLLSGALLLPALWNGFPFVFYDTGAYLWEGIGRLFIAERSPAYSLFLDFAGARESLWYVVIVQALLTSFVIVQAVRAEIVGATFYTVLSIGAGLLFLTSLPWFAGEIEPDGMTGVAVLSIYLLGFRARRLGWPRAIVLVLIAAFAIAVHSSHIGLVAGLVACLMLVKLTAYFVRGRARLPNARVALPTFSLALGVALVLSSNYVLTEKIFLSRSGPVFLMARMMGDGIVKRLLDETCPAAHYRLCAYKDALPKRADGFLWGYETPFNKLGRFDGMEKESKQIVAESFRRYPLLEAASAAQNAVIQFSFIRTGDGIEPQEWVLHRVFDKFMPKQKSAYLEARQQRGQIRFILINVLQVTAAVFAMILLGFEIRHGVQRRRWHALQLPAFVFVALLGNALVCGIFSGPHDRYQSRLIWIAPFTVAIQSRYARALFPRQSLGLAKASEV